METLQRQEALIVQLCNAQPDAVIWYIPVHRFDEELEQEVVADFEVHYCNEAAGVFLNTAREAVIGQRVLQTRLVDAGYRQSLFDQLFEAWQGGVTTHNTIYNAFLGRYYDTVRTPIAGGVLSVMRDRTRQHLQDRDLRRQTELLHAVIHTSPSCIVFCEAIREEGAITDFRLLLVNEKISRDLGRSREELEGTTYCTLHPAIRENGYLDLLIEVAQTGRAFKGEMFLANFGGWLYVTVNRVEKDKLVISCTDLSAQKGREEDLGRQAALMQELIDACHTGIYLMEPELDAAGSLENFRFKVVNEPMARFTGLQPAEVKGRLTTELFPHFRDHELFYRYRQVWESGMAERFEYHHKTEQYDLWLDISVKRIGTDLLVSFHDFTEAKRLQLELEESVRGLQRANAHLDEFAHAASFDMKEPLRKLHFFADRLKALIPRSDEADYLYTRMDSALHRMNRLLDDLLAHARAGVQTQPLQPVDLQEVVRALLIEEERRIAAAGALVYCEELPQVKGHRTGLLQLFRILLDNALTYCAPGRTPEIRFCARQMTTGDTAWHCIEVKDNGIGFDPLEKERIFHVFQRLHGNSESPGTGIGLSIARRIAENHRGTIEADSRPGGGSVFRLLLPQ